MKTFLVFIALSQFISVSSFAQITPQEEEAAESSPSSPPLATDDPGTPGTSGVELNIITDCDLTKDANSCEEGLDLAIGIGEMAQFRISKGISLDNGYGQKSFTLGSTDAGIKYRVFDRNGLQIAVFPSIDFDDARGISPGNEVEPEGQSIYLPLIISKEVGSGASTLTIVTNVAYRKNFTTYQNDSVFSSVAIGKALGPNSRLMGEVAGECTPFNHYCRADLRVGWVKVIAPKDSHKFETAFFTSGGLGLDTNRTLSPTVLFGLQVLKKPRK